MAARLCAFVIWALVAASAAFWGLRLFVRAPGAPAHTVAASDTASMRADLTRMFGAPRTAAAEQQPAPPALASRFQLAGVMAPKKGSSDYGVALIAVDGKLPRAFRVGSAIDGEIVLKAVSLRTAEIGKSTGGENVVLQMPALPPPNTGTLPSDRSRSATPATVAPPGVVPGPTPTPPSAAPPVYMPSGPNGRVGLPPNARGYPMPPPEENEQRARAQ
jgi:general secretion pathway protein C